MKPYAITDTVGLQCDDLDAGEPQDAALEYLAEGYRTARFESGEECPVPRGEHYSTVLVWDRDETVVLKARIYADGSYGIQRIEFEDAAQ